MKWNRIRGEKLYTHEIKMQTTCSAVVLFFFCFGVNVLLLMLVAICVHGLTLWNIKYGVWMRFYNLERQKQKEEEKVYGLLGLLNYLHYTKQ